MVTTLTNFILGINKAKIDSLKLDASIEESHNYSSEVTTFPVEDGSNINDHVIQKPIRLTINGFITNTPLSVYERLENLDRAISLDKATNVSLALEKLTELLQGKSNINGIKEVGAIKIVTGLKTYENMILTSLTVPRNKNTGQSLRFTAEFLQVKFIKSAVSVANKDNLRDEAIPQAESQVSAGKQVPKTASTKTTETSESLLYSLFN